MRLAVLGATGRSGVPLVEQAVAAGHEVAALVRTPSKRELLPAEVEVVEGDARDQTALARLVEGADAVLDLTGPTKGGPDDLRRTVVPALLSAMREADVDRLVLLTGAGVRVPGDQPGIGDRVIRGIMRLTVPAVLEDGTAAVTAARAAEGIRETIVRGPRLVDGSRDTPLRVAPGVGRGHGTTLGRDDLARFLLEVATSDAHVGEAPVVSW